jgi:hypothetical protein
VVFTVTWLGKIYRFVAVPGLVIISFTLCTVRMPNIVSIVFLKLFVVNVRLLCHFPLPVRQRLLHVKTDTFEEKAKLETAIMLQVVLLFQDLVQCLHAGWERLPRVIV